jgi:hypothetical protein
MAIHGRSKIDVQQSFEKKKKKNKRLNGLISSKLEKHNIYNFNIMQTHYHTEVADDDDSFFSALFQLPTPPSPLLFTINQLSTR